MELGDLYKRELGLIFESIKVDVKDYIDAMKMDENIKEKFLKAGFVNNTSYKDILIVFDNIDKFEYILYDNPDIFYEMSLMDEVNARAEFFRKLFLEKKKITELKSEVRENRLKNLLK